jgi:hypothetical protein
LAQRKAGPGTGRRKRGGIGTAKLVAIAFGLGVLCMGTLTAKAVISSSSCNNRPVLVNIAASPDIEPAVANVANSFNKQNVTSAGRCVQVQVSSADSGAEAAQIDGQAGTQSGVPDAWIPDSSLWVNVAQMHVVGAKVVQPTGRSVARSPLMLVTTKSVAAQTGIFAVPPSWNVLLPSAFGGPPASLHLTVDLPDPSSSAAGLASLTEISRELNSNDTDLARFARSVQLTASFDSAATLGQFVQAMPASGHPAVTVASEQAVLAYDRAAPSAPLAAQYPTSLTKMLATPELDYPYVLTGSQAVTVQAARIFGDYLQTKYAQSMMRYFGFRSANGVPDVMPSSAGLASQPLQLASAASGPETDSNMQLWQKLGLGSRDLVVIDVSPAMGQPSGFNGLSILKMVSQTAAAGLGFFPNSTEMGLWEMGTPSSASQPYKPLVPIGPLAADYGLVIRRTQIQQFDATMTNSAAGTPLALYDTILAGYQQMTRTYAQNYSNALIVLTSGADTARGDMSLNSLVAQLTRMYDPNKKVGIFILMFGSQGNLAAMNRIANATGGLAVKISNPSQIASVFFEGISKRMCSQACSTP